MRFPKYRPMIEAATERRALGWLALGIVTVIYMAPVQIAIVHQLIGGLRASMGYVGCKDMDEMRTKPEFVRISGAGMQESHVHDVTITKEAPNYRT